MERVADRARFVDEGDHVTAAPGTAEFCAKRAGLCGGQHQPI
jgi:hypothetical protein